MRVSHARPRRATGSVTLEECEPRIEWTPATEEMDVARTDGPMSVRGGRESSVRVFYDERRNTMNWLMVLVLVLLGVPIVFGVPIG